MKNKKILLETIIIPMCIAYLIYTLLNNHELTSKILCYITLFITSLEFIIKNFKEVYIYEHKHNVFKMTFGIFNIILLFLMVLTIFYKTNVINLIFSAGIILLLIYLLYYSVTNLIKIAKNDKNLYRCIIRAFLSLVSFSIILPTLIIIM